MRALAKAVAIVAIVFSAGSALAQKTCSTAESTAAEKALDRVVNWELLHKTWQTYAHCDTLMTEDLFTDALMRMMVEWKNADQFLKRYQSEAEFKAFVHKHMKTLTAKDDVKSVYSRVKSNCPAAFTAACAELEGVAKEAMK